METDSEEPRSPSPPEADDDAQTRLAAREERLRFVVSKVADRERRNYRRSALILTVSFTLGFGWLIYSFYRVQRLDQEYDQKSAMLTGTTHDLTDKQEALRKIKLVLDECRQGRCDPQKVQEALGYANSGLNVGDVVTLATPLPTPTSTPTATATPTPARPTPTPRQSSTPAPSPTPARIQNGFISPYYYRGPDGTRITIQVSAEGRKQPVSFSLNGKVGTIPIGSPFNFVVTKSNANPTRLVLSFSFGSDDVGDIYIVSVKASDGSSLSFKVPPPLHWGLSEITENEASQVRVLTFEAL